MAPTYHQGSWSVHKAFLLKETKTTVTSPERTQYIQTPAVTASIVTKAGLDCHISGVDIMSSVFFFRTSLTCQCRQQAQTHKYAEAKKPLHKVR